MNNTTTSKHWALAVLKEQGYTVKSTPYGYIIYRSGFSFIAGTVQELTDFAEEEANHEAA